MSNKINKEFAISTWAINNKMTVYVITAILLIGGLISYYAMPRESFPEIVETKILRKLDKSRKFSRRC